MRPVPIVCEESEDERDKQGAKQDTERAKAEYDQKVAILQGMVDANHLRG